MTVEERNRFIKQQLQASIEILHVMVYAIDKDVDFPLLSDLDELAAVRKHIDYIEFTLITHKGKP